MLVWINAKDEAVAHDSMIEVLSRLHYEEVEIERIKAIDSEGNDFTSEMATAYETMLGLGWCVVAYPEPIHLRS